MKVFRVSGIRLDPKSHLFAAQFETCIQQALKLGLKVFQEAQKEPFLFYDNEKNKPIYQLIQGMLLQGELFFPEVEGEICGYASFRNVFPQKCASLEIFLAPNFRKSRILGEFRSFLETQAFSKFPEGLQLLKLKASIHPGNHSSLKACKNSGFVALCDLPYEGCFQGALSPMIYLELYPKEIRDLLKPHAIAQPEISSNVKQSINPSNPELLSSGSDNNPGKLNGNGGLQCGTDDSPTASSLPNSQLPERLPVGKQRPSRRRSPRTTKPLPESGHPT